MLKWTKRTEPNSGSGDAASNIATLLLAQNDNNQRLHARRSLGNLSRPQRTANRERQRKSLGSSEISKRIQNRDKENQHIQLTPHPLGCRQNVTSTPVIAFGTKLDYALRDVRNITPKQQQQNSITALINAVTPSRKRPLAKTPPISPKIDRVICSSPKETALTQTAVISQQTPYASTLPTFDVEYSPCGPTQSILATNPVNTITDSYFNQPRYFQEPLPASKRLKFSPNGLTPLSTRLSELRFSRLNFKGAKKSIRKSKSCESPKINENRINLDGITTTTTIVNERGNMLLNNNNDKNKNQNDCVNSRKQQMNEMGTMKAPNQRHAIRSNETSLSSSAMDDTAIEKMIDAILESARKERPSIVRNLAPRKMHTALMQTNSNSPTYTAAEDPASDLNKFCDNFQISPDKLIGERTIILEEPNAVNEREIRTPEPLDKKKQSSSKSINRSKNKLNKSKTRTSHLRRQRAVRRKHTTHKSQKDKVIAIELQQSDTISSSTEHSDGDCLKPLPSNLSSPKTPSDSDFVMSSFFKKTTAELANMNTPIIDSSDANVTYAQQPHCGITSITSKISSDSTPCIHTNDLQASSTPTNIDTVKSIRRCLTFSDSPSGGSSTTDDSLEKRKSTASSTTNSMASVSNLSNSTRNNAIVSGSLDLAIFCENNKIYIHGESLV